MLTVGVDSYVTLDEANNIAKNNFMSSDPAFSKWSELSDNDKEVLLRTSCRDIDTLKFDGRRANIGQKLEFPRVDSAYVGYGTILYIGQYFDNGLYSPHSVDGGLSDVKLAQVINSVYGSLYSDMLTEQIGVKIQGLTSKKAGPIAESYNTNNSTNSEAMKGIYTKKVYSILNMWLSSTYLAL